MPLCTLPNFIHKVTVLFLYLRVLFLSLPNSPNLQILHLWPRAKIISSRARNLNENTELQHCGETRHISSKHSISPEWDTSPKLTIAPSWSLHERRSSEQKVSHSFQEWAWGPSNCIDCIFYRLLKTIDVLIYRRKMSRSQYEQWYQASRILKK